MSDAYTKVGVNYNDLDPFKRLAQQAARRTARMASRHGMRELEWSRGESAYLTALPDGRIMGVVEEGLGTKNLVASKMQELTGKCHFAAIAQDTVAMIVNDMLTLGVLPAVVTMHAAVGRSEWFTDEQRASSLANGWAAACIMAGAVFGCGESPVLKGNVEPEGLVLNGSAVGFVESRYVHYPESIEVGDKIIILPSNGIHANGLTLARDVASKIPDGYLNRLPIGKAYGEALLAPTAIYTDAIIACQRACGEYDRSLIRYGVNITGHGWRKLMRASKPFIYEIERLPSVQQEFHVIQNVAEMDDREMYATFNMGGGFALFVDAERAEIALKAIHRAGFPGAIIAGSVLRESSRRELRMLPLDAVYYEEELQIR